MASHYLGRKNFRAQVAVALTRVLGHRTVGHLEHGNGAWHPLNIQRGAAISAAGLAVAVVVVVVDVDVNMDGLTRGLAYQAFVAFPRHRLGADARYFGETNLAGPPFVLQKLDELLGLVARASKTIPA